MWDGLGQNHTGRNTRVTEGSFSAGIGRVTITPPMTAPHDRWGAQVHVLPDGIHKELYGTVLVVSDGRTTAAFCELEVVVISREQSDSIRSAVADEHGITVEHVRCS